MKFMIAIKSSLSPITKLYLYLRINSCNMGTSVLPDIQRLVGLYCGFEKYFYDANTTLQLQACTVEAYRT